MLNFFFQENAFENADCKISATTSFRSRCVTLCTFHICQNEKSEIIYLTTFVSCVNWLWAGPGRSTNIFKSLNERGLSVRFRRLIFFLSSPSIWQNTTRKIMITSYHGNVCNIIVIILPLDAIDSQVTKMPAIWRYFISVCTVVCTANLIWAINADEAFWHFDVWVIHYLGRGQSYLTDGKQHVTYNGATCSTKTIRCGLPQGSTFGPLLFYSYQWSISCL